MRFILPLPPSDNRRLIFAPRLGRMVSSKLYRNFQHDAKIDISKQARKQGLWKPIGPTFESQLTFKIFFFLKDKRRDATDMLKGLLDCMKGIIYDDDKWCIPQIQHPYKISKESPHILIYFDMLDVKQLHD